MAEIIYMLCTLTSVACAWLLLCNYRQSKSRLLLWSGLCFVVLTVNNILLVFDKIIFPTEIDLSTWRLAAALFAPLLLLYGPIGDTDIGQK